MRRRLLAGLLTLGTVAAPARAAGQQPDAPEAPGTVAPGGIATVTVTVALPPLAAGDTLDYELHLAPGFRPYFPRTGFLAVPAGEEQVTVPITLGVPAGAPAGRTFAGRLRLRAPAGSTVSDSLWVHVAAEHALEARLTAAAPTVAPGGEIELGYRVRNRGNAVDTVALRLGFPSTWGARGLPGEVVLAAGDTAVGTVTLIVPRDLPRGHEQSIALTAEGGASARSAVELLLADPDPALLDGWSQLPGTLFVGSSLGDEPGTSLALQGAGELAPGTRVALSVKRRQSALTPAAFQDRLFGPRFRVELERGGLRAAAGEVQTLGGVLSAPVLAGRGAAGRFDGGSWSSELYLARPGGIGSDLDGHQLRATTTLRTDRGSVGLTVADTRERWPWTPGYRSTGAGLGYRIPDDDTHDLWLQAGALSVRPDSGESAAGATLDGRYRFTRPGARLELRGRLIPGTVVTNAALANELFASAAVGLLPGLALKGWGQLRSAPVLGSDYRPETSALFLGARTELGPAELEFGGLHRRTANGVQAAVERRAASLGIDLPAGGLALQADALIGRYTRGPLSGPVTELWGGAQWQGATQDTWARIGARYMDSEYADGQVYFDLSGAADLDRVRVEGGFASRLEKDRTFREGLSVWTGVDVRVLPHTRVTAGADYQPGLGETSWRFSLGVTRELRLPLPIPHTPELRGHVFEDRNGNRTRDPGEPALPGVRIQVGRLETRTGDDGEFSFRQTFGAPMRVDPASLPVTMALPPDFHAPPSGEVEIPVVQAGAVEVDLFVDRDGDGVRDRGEEPAARTLLSLVDERGVARDLEADEQGHARFGAVAPGSYRLRVFRRASGPGGGAAVERQVRVEPGRTVRLTVPVPARERTIRMGTGAGLRLDPGRR